MICLFRDKGGERPVLVMYSAGTLLLIFYEYPWGSLSRAASCAAQTGACLMWVCFFNGASYTERLQAMAQSAMTISEEAVVPVHLLITLVASYNSSPNRSLLIFKDKDALLVSFSAVTLALSQFHLNTGLLWRIGVDVKNVNTCAT